MPPRTSSGHRLQLVASGLTVPTAFAFGDGRVFAADGGSLDRTHPGGVFLLEHGRARRLPGSPTQVFGITWHGGALYLSTPAQLIRWSGFNGSRFSGRRPLYTSAASFSGFNGIGFGADGRLYAGVYAGTADHGPATTPYARDVLSFTSTGRDLRVVARGIRQPWQMVFPPHSSSPFVSDLGQDAAAANPPDFILRIRPGQNYGFSKCNWTSMGPCRGYARPLRFLKPHTDPMGLGIIGSRLYVSEYGDVYPPKVVSMPLTGGALRTEATGFTAPIVGLGTHAGWVYVGETNGQIWRFRAS
jgi:glucose/arabinose dehydrogenase